MTWEVARGRAVLCHGAGRGARWGMSLCLLLLAACGSSSGSPSKAALSGGGGTTEVAGETDIQTSVSAMEKGDLLLVDVSSGSATLDLSTASSGAKFILMVQSKKETAGSLSSTVGNESTALAKSHVGLGLGSALGVQEQFHDFLRSSEANLDASAAAGALTTSGVAKSISKAVSVGDVGTFRVLSSLYTTTSYSTVTATARCVNSSIALYLDSAAENNLTAAQITSLCSGFAESLSEEYGILGAPSDINEDGVVTVLMTKEVNELGASGGGIVTGFFFAGDLLTNSTSNPASNEREIVFVLTPDPLGQYGTAIPVDFALSNLLPAVVPHEVQHLLSYYYHAMVNGGGAEQSWLNEAMSHLIEDVVGYGLENPSRVDLHLAETYDAALIPTGSQGLAERGAAYLFLRFLYEQVADDNAFLQSLVQTDVSGLSNLQAAVGSANSNFDAWNEWLLRWGVAVAVTDANVTTDARYVYEKQSTHNVTGNATGVCLHCSVSDNRGTVLSGPTLLNVSASSKVNVKAGAQAYYDLSTPPSSLTVTVGDGTNMQAVLIRTN